MVSASHAVTPAALDPTLYRQVLGRFATGVTVVTSTTRTRDAVQPWGTTVNSFTSVSLDPPMVLICIGHERSIHPVIEAAGRFAVNVLSEESQELSDCFSGAPSALPRSSFCNAEYALGPTGLPRLSAAIACIECELERTLEVGDHTVYIGRVVDLLTREDDDWPLLYYRGQYLRIEHAETAEVLGKPDV